MGAIGGLLGTSGGANGTGFAAPVTAPIVSGTNAGQLQTSYGGAQNSLASQQALLQALQAQGGLNNQNQVYGQLQGVVNGTGPNPAATQLAQATGANTANQAALMAGQRGAGANVGLIARQAAQQGAANQQNAIGQAATLQANQSLNALGQAGTIANTQAANQIGATTANTQANQSEQQILQNAASQQNNANVAQQGNINSGNVNLASTTMQGQQGVVGGVLGGAGAALGLAGGGMVPNYDSGGLIQDALKLAPLFAAAQGGTVPGYADGGVSGPQSSVGQYTQGWAPILAQSPNQAGAPQMQGAQTGAGALQKGVSSFGAGAAKSLKGAFKSTPTTSQPADPTSNSDAWAAQMGAPGTTTDGTIPTSQANYDVYQAMPSPSPQELARGGNVGSKLKSGGPVPGKAAVPGNSPANDKVKALLSPGEGVLDRETMQDPGPVGHTARILMAIVNAKKKGAK